MQEEIAPFALEYPGCIGNESRLVDCPESRPIPPERAYDFVPFSDRDYVFGCGAPKEYSRDDYFADYSNFDVCDPYSANYARVTCGTLTSPSTLLAIH